MKMPADEQVRPVRAAEIFATLQGRILRWEYPPGYRFTEESLCKEFEVSRSPVRETLRMLEEHGLVDKVPYRGCTVKQPDLQAIGELYDVRLIMELAVVERLAVQGLSAAIFSALRDEWTSLGAVESYAEVDGAKLADTDRAFHEALAAAAGNATLLELLRDVNDRLHFIRMTDITSVERLGETCREHLRILDQIVAGDPAQAAASMRANIEGARAHVHAAIKEVIARAYLSRATWQ
jgi:DNA-binding GntR family transcriptional regulator